MFRSEQHERLYFESDREFVVLPNASGIITWPDDLERTAPKLDAVK
jgi:hypothetical protein